MDRRLATRAAGALLLANARYWTGVAPLVRRALRRWRARARAIEDPALRALALAKLEREGFNAEAAAMLATLAPRRHRRAAVEAIVAAEVLYDYLDGLTEAPAREAPADGGRLFAAFTDALAPSAPCAGGYYRHHSRREEVYLEELVRTIRRALATLPASAAVAGALRDCAARGAQAQLRIHGAPDAGAAGLERWARAQAVDASLGWREFLAGAAGSVLAAHALVAAAADPRTTREQAREIDRIYLLISTLPTILDSLVDHDADAAAGRGGYHRHYADRAALAEGLAGVIDEALERCRGAPRGAHHAMTLVGVFAYYASAPEARGEPARAVVARLAPRLRPLLAPTLALMRGWRVARRTRRRGRRAGAVTQRSPA